MTARVFDSFFEFQPLALQHVEEIGVAAEIELVGPVQPHAALAEQAGQHTVDDRGAHLGLDVVPDHRQPRILEPPPPLLARGDEDGNAVHEGAAGLERLLGIPAGRLLRADGQVGDEHVRAGLAQGPRDIVLTLGCFGDAGAQIAADAVHRRPAPDLDAQVKERRRSGWCCWERR